VLDGNVTDKQLPLFCKRGRRMSMGRRRPVRSISEVHTYPNGWCRISAAATMVISGLEMAVKVREPTGAIDLDRTWRFVEYAILLRAQMEIDRVALTVKKRCGVIAIRRTEVRPFTDRSFRWLVTSPRIRGSDSCPTGLEKGICP
jgi:hypothetical protein